MIKVIDGDLFDSDAKIICHQVNCQGRMGSGVALQVKNKYPEAYTEYKKMCDEFRDCTRYLLGTIQLIPTNLDKTQFICNLFAQDNYGYDGKKYTSTEALKSCFISIRNVLECEHGLLHNAKIAMPWKISCARGGANWDEVYHMIDEIFADFEVELWRFDKG